MLGSVSFCIVAVSGIFSTLATRGKNCELPVVDRNDHTLDTPQKDMINMYN